MRARGFKSASAVVVVVPAVDGAAVADTTVAVAVTAARVHVVVVVEAFQEPFDRLACLRVELALRPAGGIGIESQRPTHSPRVLVERACPPRGEFLFRLDASEAATSRAVV